MIAYDTNVLVYALETPGPFTEAARDIIRRGEQEGARLSVLVYQELLTGAVLQDSNLHDMLTEALDSLLETRFLDVTMEVVEMATSLTKQYGKHVRGYDALILATAIVSGADTFYTNDTTLTRLGVAQINVIGLA